MLILDQSERKEKHLTLEREPDSKVRRDQVVTKKIRNQVNRKS